MGDLGRTVVECVGLHVSSRKPSLPPDASTVDSTWSHPTLVCSTSGVLMIAHARWEGVHHRLLHDEARAFAMRCSLTYVHLATSMSRLRW